VTAEPIIRLDRVHKSYGSIKALHTISLEIAAGEFFTLVGPSGCGKTTLLRLLAGFEVPNGGTVMIDSMNMAGVPANRRPTNMVFQNYAVFPHMNVADNIAYGLRAHRVEPGMMGQADRRCSCHGWTRRPGPALPLSPLRWPKTTCGSRTGPRSATQGPLA